MDSSENLFRLNYEDFGAKIQETWKQFEFEKDYSDMILACGGQQLQTHKIIISSYSPVIRSILKDLKQNSNQTPIIYLKGVNFSDLQNLMTFIYQGEINISENSVGSFLGIAKDLEINGLHVDFERKWQSRLKEEPTLPLEHLGVIESKKSSKKKKLDEKQQEGTQETDSKSFQILQNYKDEFEQDTPIQKESEKIECKIDKDLIISDSFDQNTISCEKCDTIFTARSSLKNHIQSIHEGINFPCDQCEHKASRKGHLKRHIEVMHEGIRYPCEKCNYKATCKTSLKIHNGAAHEGINYPCQQCSYKAKLKYNLHKHVKKVHGFRKLKLK